MGGMSKVDLDLFSVSCTAKRAEKRQRNEDDMRKREAIARNW